MGLGEALLGEAERLMAQGRPDLAEACLNHLLRDEPQCIDAAVGLAQIELSRGDAARALQHLELASRIDPTNVAVRIDIAQLMMDQGDASGARGLLERLLSRDPGAYDAWLVLARTLDITGSVLAALQARYEAVTRAQRQDQWTTPVNTPPHLLNEVLSAIQQIRNGRAALLRGVVSDLRISHGNVELKRVDQALAGYIGDEEIRPRHPRQRPRFLYFPGLPDHPFLDPYLHPWAKRLREGFAAMRSEVDELLAGGREFPGFIDFKPGDKVEKFLASSGPPPSWEAYFFYRHGQRFDQHHQQCPRTSALLENLELCRIPGQAPEICFSILRPGSHILPHHGVTNARVVMHLPLKVPADCMLRLVDAGDHAWREGELVMFDDTYLHEAWNRSSEVRVILLMDSWNPHLSAVEREAVIRVTQLVDGLRLAGERVDAGCGETARQ